MAGLDIAPAPGDMRLWIPEQNKVLGAGLAVVHTWSPLMHLMRRLVSGKQQSGLPPGGFASAGGMSRVVPPAGGMLVGQTVASTSSMEGCDLPSIASGAAAKALEAADGVEAVAGRQGLSIASATWLPSPQEIHSSQV